MMWFKKANPTETLEQTQPLEAEFMSGLGKALDAALKLAMQSGPKQEAYREMHDRLEELYEMFKV